MTNLDQLKFPSLLPLKGTSSGRVAYYRFLDIDELAAFLPEDISLTQLSCQPFDCQSMALVFEPIRFSFNHINGKLHAVGDKYTDFLTFTYILYGHGYGQPIIANHLPITQDYLWGFDPHREADLVFPGNSIHCAIHIRQGVFEACAQAMDRADLNANFLGKNYVYMPETIQPLQGYLKQLYDLLKQKSPLLQRPDFQQVILKDFLPLLIAALPTQPAPRSSNKAFRRSHLVKQANDYMQSHVDQGLTLTDLCQALGTSSRALSYGFQEMFGVSPMAYLKLLRLQGVRRALKAAEFSHHTVTEIATQFGFCHLGIFARDYKQVFGELPSETLKSSQQR